MKTFDEAIRAKQCREGSEDQNRLVDEFEKMEPVIDEAIAHPVTTLLVADMLSLDADPDVFGKACFLAGLQIGLEMNRPDWPEAAHA